MRYKNEQGRLGRNQQTGIRTSRKVNQRLRLRFRQASKTITFHLNDCRSHPTYQSAGQAVSGEAFKLLNLSNYHLPNVLVLSWGYLLMVV
jgi:hypothetical protein